MAGPGRRAEPTVVRHREHRLEEEPVEAIIQACIKNPKGISPVITLLCARSEWPSPLAEQALRTARLPRPVRRTRSTHPTRRPVVRGPGEDRMQVVDPESLGFSGGVPERLALAGNRELATPSDRDDADSELTGDGSTED